MPLDFGGNVDQSLGGNVSIGLGGSTPVGGSGLNLYYEVEDFGSHQFGFGPQLTTDGIVGATLEVVLPKNAVVRTYDVVVKALRASATVVQNVAQVRTQESTLGTSAVVDFGTPRTVSAVRAPLGLQIVTVKAWTGAAFANTNVYSATVMSKITKLPGQSQKTETVVDADPPSTDRTAIFASEVRTERLLVDMVGTANAGELGAGMAVVLPESPQGLELRIDGAQPVFTDPGPVSAGPDSALTDSTWNSSGERIVHLGGALAALTGDPAATGDVTFKVALTSRVPGVLGLRLLPGGQDVHRIRRVLFGSDANKDLAFDAEGVTDVRLESLPPNLTIEEVRFTASGTFPPERVLPPVGPDESGVAELVADATRALLVRLRKLTGLAELTGVRLPLRGGAGGGEAAIALWSNKAADIDEPLEAIPQAVTTPVTFGEAAGDSDVWTTFEFRQPVPIDSTNPPWAALLVTRGELSCEAGAFVSGLPPDPLGENIVRRGPPTGPWRPLPAPFLTGSTGLAAARGRVRMIGHAPKDAPLPPVKVELPGGTFAAGVTPTAKGVQAVFHPPAPVAQADPTLRITHYAAGTLTIRDIDVVSTT
jgi:hypothetical protein